MRRLLATFALILAALPALPALAGGTVIASGSFVGDSRHNTSGSVQILRDGGKVIIRLGGYFFLRRRPRSQGGAGPRRLCEGKPAGAAAQ